jgi:hypothetical protein
MQSPDLSDSPLSKAARLDFCFDTLYDDSNIQIAQDID